MGYAIVSEDEEEVAAAVDEEVVVGDAETGEGSSSTIPIGRRSLRQTHRKMPDAAKVGPKKKNDSTEPKGFF
jgi:hypothetical protein